jgi:hypothetical protein
MHVIGISLQEIGQGTAVVIWNAVVESSLDVVEHKVSVAGELHKVLGHFGERIGVFPGVAREPHQVVCELRPIGQVKGWRVDQ